MVGLMAFTLVVVLGTGDSVAATPPDCPLRPDSGSCVGIVLGGGEPPNCPQPPRANTRIEAVTPIRRATRTVEGNLFIFFCSCLSLANELLLPIIARALGYFSRRALHGDSTSSSERDRSEER